ncbi:hypothetical protein O181_111782 [Austropuccinia psidii MF-1]|uniref:Uncharacterized protein n=1 Tax=Austropuccinia psidii MF-1 TaxID=1389203 RepID=A0A9Q3K0J2_9BASI|nr:hypothetical protein [Austropuccinia psidii MF-1]
MYPGDLLHPGYEREQAWLINLLHHLGQCHLTAEKDQQCSHFCAESTPYHEHLATRSMVDHKVFQLPLLLRCPPNMDPINLFPELKCGLVRPNHLGPIVDCPMAVGMGKGKASLEVLRLEVGFFGSNARLLTQLVDLALDLPSGDLVSQKVSDLCNC